MKTSKELQLADPWHLTRFFAPDPVGWGPYNLGQKVKELLLLFWAACCFLYRGKAKLQKKQRKCKLK